MNPDQTPSKEYCNPTEIYKIWEEFIKTGQLQTGNIRREIAESWERCRSSGVNPNGIAMPDRISDEGMEKLKNSKKILMDTSAVFIEMLRDTLKGLDFFISLTDNLGNLLLCQNVGHTSFSPANHRWIQPGLNVSEEVYGTTAIGLVIKNKKPFQIAGAEHYTQEFHAWACFAAPISDEKKNLLGVINISSESDWVDRCILAMITSTAKAIENEIAIQNINSVLIKNNHQMAATLSAVTDGVVYVKNDRIIQINKTMSEFLGRPEKEVINQNINEGIIAFPSIEESFKKVGGESHVEIMITGMERNYDCLLHIQPINDAENSYIMIFTRTDQIRMLARKINKHNAFFTFDDIIGKSFQIKESLTLAKKASNYNYKIIIEGESGTGKEMFAQAIHNNSARKHKPFITFDCGAVPHELFERELFGYNKSGILQSRYEEKPGKFELANGGTIFLDDITNMPMDVQAKMLRVLQEEKIIRIGGTDPIPLDVRIIVASNTNLEREVKNGNFRSDLFFRLNVIFIRIPPLRERREDISILVDYFLAKTNLPGEITVEKKAMNMLERYHWPGNVRELHNAVDRAAMICDGYKIKKIDFALNILDVSGNDPGKADMNTLNDQIKNYIIQVLEHTDGNISEAARILNVSRATIYSILNRPN